MGIELILTWIQKIVHPAMPYCRACMCNSGIWDKICQILTGQQVGRNLALGPLSPLLGSPPTRIFRGCYGKQDIWDWSLFLMIFFQLAPSADGFPNTYSSPIPSCQHRGPGAQTAGVGDASYCPRPAGKFKIPPCRQFSASRQGFFYLTTCSI